MELIREAYGYSNRPAIDVTGPGWIDQERFDIVIHADREDMGPEAGAGLVQADGSCVGIYAPPGPQPRCPFVLGGGGGDVPTTVHSTRSATTGSMRSARRAGM